MSDIPDFTTRDGDESENTEPDSDAPTEPPTEAPDDGLGSELEDLESQYSEADPDSMGEESRKNRITNALRSTEPHKPLREIESPWDPDNGGINRIYRGLQKISGIEGTEAWMDISIGIMEWVSLQNDEPINGDSNDSGDEDISMEQIPTE